MLDAARTAVQAVQGHQQQDLSSDTVWMLGLVKCLEIIGEAAGRLSEAVRERNAEIPWHLITGMRHRLVHAYFQIDEEQLWKTLTGDLIVLIPHLEQLLASESSQVPGGDSESEKTC
jgi:uncharacterized protein with HEPN domain